MSTGRSDLALGAGWAWPLELKIDRRARRLKLRLDPARRRVVLVAPSRWGRRAALDWARSQTEWVERQIALVAPAEPLAPGATIPLDGTDIALLWRKDAGRTPALAGGTLTCGGPAEGFERRILRWLRARALETLSAETAQSAARAGVSVVSVRIGDASTRWGSCSADGAIRYNWRLVMAPPNVRRWVVAHEVAHRVHMNHGPAFKALERQLFDGDPAAARLELRRIGSRLKGIGGRL